MSHELRNHIDQLWKRIESMEQRIEIDPSRQNKMVLDCMLKDYVAKQKLLIKHGQTEI